MEADVAVGRIPEEEFSRAIQRNGSVARAVEGHRIDRVGVAGEVTDRLQRVPGQQSPAAVPANHRNDVAVGRDVHGQQASLDTVPEDTNFGISLQWPHSQCAIQAGTGQLFDLGIERHAGDLVGVSLECPERFAGFEVPQPHGAVATGGGQQFVVGAER